MTLAAQGRLLPWRTSSWYASRARRGSILFGAVAFGLAGAYAAAIVATEGAAALVVPVAGALVGIAVFARPVSGVYMLFGAALLFEQWEIAGLAPITAQTHFFQNISGFTQLPIRVSLSDLLVFLTLASWGARRLISEVPTRSGPLATGIAAVGAAFALGGAIGLARGGTWDGIAALAEVRGPAYLCLLYFLSANLITHVRQVTLLMGEIVVLVGVKALQGIWNYQDMLSGLYSLEAVTAHEDVVFFDLALAMAALVIALRIRSKLGYALLALQPLVIGAELLTQRRVAFITLLGVLVVVALMTYREQPRRTVLLVGAAAFVFALYAGVFWERSGALAEPARALRSVIDPGSRSARDLLSDFWREIENTNISYTVRQLPLTGVGLGQQYLLQQAPPPLATTFVYWRFITHNAILWIWLKAGPLAAFAWWFLVAQAIIVGGTLYRRLADPRLKLAAAMPITLIVMQVIFSSVDLGLTYSRTMIVLGVALGLTTPLAAWAARDSASASGGRA